MELAQCSLSKGGYLPARSPKDRASILHVILCKLYTKNDPLNPPKFGCQTPSLCLCANAYILMKQCKVLLYPQEKLYESKSNIGTNTRACIPNPFGPFTQSNSNCSFGI